MQRTNAMEETELTLDGECLETQLTVPFCSCIRSRQQYLNRHTISSSTGLVFDQSTTKLIVCFTHILRQLVLQQKAGRKSESKTKAVKTLLSQRAQTSM